MDKQVLVISADSVRLEANQKPRKLRVAAYCRVSTEEERQLDSFENQVEHYEQHIAENSAYELVGIYSDEGISGCSTRSRTGFRAMIRDCEAGKIDLVITKSISRFARNTQDSLTYTRRLKDMGVGVIFEKEGINTLESSGELLLTLFSCFAQEESRSISENTAWGIRSRFQQGIPHLNAKNLFGYDKLEDGGLGINAEQAEAVRLIYRCFLEGWSLNAIAARLNREQVPGVHGEARWCSTTVSRVLANEKYKGALLMQKTFTVNYLTRQRVVNSGQLDQYYVEDDHPAIISPEEWEATQLEIARRREFRTEHNLRGLYGSGDSPFYAKLFCSKCRCKLQRIYHRGVAQPYWECNACGERIDDEELRARFCAAFNGVVARVEELRGRWEAVLCESDALQRLRARQMLAICEEGPIAYEIPELTQAVLQEAWLGDEGDLRFVFLSGEEVRG